MSHGGHVDQTNKCTLPQLSHVIWQSVAHCAKTTHVGVFAVCHLKLKTWCSDNASAVTILPHVPQKTPQNDDMTKAADLKRHARDIARDSHGIEDEIRAMVSSYMAPKDDEDQELVIGQLVC